MTSSIIEEQRSQHAAYANLSSTLVEQIVTAPKQNVSTHRERLLHSHRSSFLLDKIVDTANALQASYADSLADRSAEISKIGGDGSGQASISEFYNRLAKLKDWHRKYPYEAQQQHSASLIDWAELEGAPAPDEPSFLDRLFSGEETLGRYFDLIEFHVMYLNLPGTSRISYLTFLDEFDKFAKIPKARKLHGEQYRQYITQLSAYLQSYASRAHPLSDLQKLQDKITNSFELRWLKGQVSSWQVDDQPNGSVAKEDGIWCAACQKTYSKESVYQAHLSSKKHIKAAANAKPQVNGHADSHANGHVQANGTSGSKDDQKAHDIALHEELVTAFLNDATSPLLTTRAETKSNIERRAALTDKERAQELEEMEAREAREAAENAANGGRPKEKKKDAEVLEVEEERIYNPLKLPLGWDGKPIPFWLYKLHGLGVEYSCEICSGASYAGRKNFERHFTEARHSFGMKALGLPNTKHFAEITKIEDAIALAEKLKAEGKQEIFRAEEMEELEDAEGNVYNRKVYNDLKTQGLL